MMRWNYEKKKDLVGLVKRRMLWWFEGMKQKGYCSAFLLANCKEEEVEEDKRSVGWMT